MSDNTDNVAFDAMHAQQNEKLYTESHYNQEATVKEMGFFDKQAKGYLMRMYAEDQENGMFRDLDFQQYVDAVSPTLFHERMNNTTDEDPEYYMQAGDLFFNTYAGDFDQFRDSAMKYSDQEK